MKKHKIARCFGAFQTIRKWSNVKELYEKEIAAAELLRTNQKRLDKLRDDLHEKLRS